MKHLTPKEAFLLGFLGGYIELHNAPPTQAVMGDQLSVGKQRICTLLKSLEDKGYIRRRKTFSIEILDLPNE